MKAIGPAAMAFLLAVAACAPPSREPSPAVTMTTVSTGGTATTVGVEQGVAQFRSCLITEGLRMEEIPLDAMGRPRLDLVLGNVDFAEEDNLAALDTCAVHLSTGALDLADAGPVGVAVLELLTEFSACIRSRGVAGFPDPVAGFNGVGSPYDIEAVPYDDEDLPTAVRTCRERVLVEEP